VETSDASVQVVDTRFSVAVGQQTSVKVESGIVACSNGRDNQVQLTPGQQASLSEGGISPVAAVDGDQAFSWLRGRLVFQDLPLADVLGEIDRYHPGKIFVANRQLANTKVTGNYKLDEPAAIVKALVEATGGTVTTISPYLTIVR
jgi:transmembrane sensor